MVTDKAVTSVLRVFLVLGAFVVLIHSKSVLKPVDKYFTVCSRANLKGLNACIEKNLINVKAYAKKGIPSLKVIPLDPMVIPKVSFKGDGLVPLEISLTNLTMTGMSNAEGTKVKADLTDDGLVLDMAMRIPDVRLKAEYSINGEVLELKLSGSGHMENNATDVVVSCHTESRVEKVEEEERLKVGNVQCKYDLNGSFRFWFYNLFDGDEALGNITNNFLNENYREVHKITRHMTEDLIAGVMKSTMDNVFSAYPFDQLFPN